MTDPFERLRVSTRKLAAHNIVTADRFGRDHVGDAMADALLGRRERRQLHELWARYR